MVSLSSRNAPASASKPAPSGSSATTRSATTRSVGSDTADHSVSAEGTQLASSRSKQIRRASRLTEVLGSPNACSNHGSITSVA